MKSKYQRAKKLLDDVFSLFIRYRDKKAYNGICPICNQRPIVCCFHFLPRGNTAIRWDPDNCVASCAGCNYNEHLTRGQAQRDDKFREAHVRIIGEARRLELEQLAHKIVKLSTEDLLEKKRYFEELMAKNDR